MRDIKVISLGSDPEFLIKDKNTGQFVSSLTHIPGSKKDPYELTSLGKGFSIQKDNVLLEFCVPPTNDPEELYQNIIKAINYTNESILPGNLEIAAVSGGEYPESELDNQYARTFGCDTSYNAWSKTVSEAINNGSDYRSSGFHIHVGCTDTHPITIMEIVKAMDLYLGVPSVIFDRDLERRKYYGKAGEFRLTSYGFEYRVLGGYVMQSKDYFDAAIKGLYKAVEFVNNEIELTDEEALDIQTAINTGSLELASKLVEQYSLQELVNLSLV